MVRFIGNNWPTIALVLVVLQTVLLVHAAYMAIMYPDWLRIIVMMFIMGCWWINWTIYQRAERF